MNEACRIAPLTAVEAFSGSMTFVYLHVAWFAVWVLVNAGFTRAPVFDPFPYGLLTRIVSLEPDVEAFLLILEERNHHRAIKNAHIRLQKDLTQGLI